MNPGGPTVEDFRRRFLKVFKTEAHLHPLGREMLASEPQRGVGQLLLDLAEAEHHRKKTTQSTTGSGHEKERTTSIETEEERSQEG